MKKISQKQGLVRTIIIIIIAIIILSYLGIDIQKTIESDQSKKNFSYVKAATLVIWERYLQRPAKFVWNIFIDYIWNPLFARLKENKDTAPHSMNFINASPGLQMIYQT